MLRPKALRWAAGFTTDFAADTYNGREVLSWKDDNRPGRVYASIFAPGKVLFSGDEATLKRGMDVMSDPALSLPADAALPTPAADGVWAFAAAEGFAGTPEALKNPVARQLADLRLELGESPDGKTTMRAAAKTTTDDAAPKLLRMAVGAQTLAEMAADNAAKPATAPADAPAAADDRPLQPRDPPGRPRPRAGRTLWRGLRADRDGGAVPLGRQAPACCLGGKERRNVMPANCRRWLTRSLRARAEHFEDDGPGR